MQSTGTAGKSLAEEILDRLEEILLEAEASTRPLEVDPQRGRLFELFVTSEAAGLVEDDAEQALSADALCRELADRWGLKQATAASIEQNVQLPREHLGRLRLMWSLMRMWMEWTYAWRRWPEFHDDSSSSPGS